MPTTPRILAAARRASLALSAALLRIVVVFVVLVYATDALVRLAVQVTPASFWFEIDRVEILPAGDVAIVWRRSHAGDLPVSSIVELIGEGGEQPCAASGRRVIERDTTYAVVPVDRLLPDCRWDALADGAYHLTVTASHPAGGTVDKSVTVRSANAILVQGGRIVGATPPV